MKTKAKIPIPRQIRKLLNCENSEILDELFDTDTSEINLVPNKSSRKKMKKSSQTTNSSKPKKSATLIDYFRRTTKTSTSLEKGDMGVSSDSDIEKPDAQPRVAPTTTNEVSTDSEQEKSMVKSWISMDKKKRSQAKEAIRPTIANPKKPVGKFNSPMKQSEKHAKSSSSEGENQIVEIPEENFSSEYKKQIDSPKKELNTKQSDVSSSDEGGGSEEHRPKNSPNKALISEKVRLKKSKSDSSSAESSDDNLSPKKDIRSDKPINLLHQKENESSATDNSDDDRPKKQTDKSSASEDSDAPPGQLQTEKGKNSAKSSSENSDEEVPSKPTLKTENITPNKSRESNNSSSSESSDDESPVNNSPNSKKPQIISSNYSNDECTTKEQLKQEKITPKKSNANSSSESSGDENPAKNSIMMEKASPKKAARTQSSSSESEIERNNKMNSVKSSPKKTFRTDDITSSRKERDSPNDKSPSKRVSFLKQKSSSDSSSDENKHNHLPLADKVKRESVNHDVSSSDESVSPIKPVLPSPKENIFSTPIPHIKKANSSIVENTSPPPEPEISVIPRLQQKDSVKSILKTKTEATKMKERKSLSIKDFLMAKHAVVETESPKNPSTTTDDEETPTNIESIVPSNMKNVIDLVSFDETDRDDLFFEDITEDSEIYIVQCPKEVDVKSFVGNKIYLNGECTLELNTSQGKLNFDSFAQKDSTDRLLNLVLPSKQSNSMKIGAFPLTGSIVLSEGLEVPTIQEFEFRVPDKIPLPLGLKERHNFSSESDVHLSEDNLNLMKKKKKKKSKATSATEDDSHTKIERHESDPVVENNISEIPINEIKEKKKKSHKRKLEETENLLNGSLGIEEEQPLKKKKRNHDLTDFVKQENIQSPVNIKKRSHEDTPEMLKEEVHSPKKKKNKTNWDQQLETELPNDQKKGLDLNPEAIQEYFAEVAHENPLEESPSKKKKKKKKTHSDVEESTDNQITVEEEKLTKKKKKKKTHSDVEESTDNQIRVEEETLTKKKKKKTHSDVEESTDNQIIVEEKLTKKKKKKTHSDVEGSTDYQITVEEETLTKKKTHFDVEGSTDNRITVEEETLTKKKTHSDVEGSTDNQIKVEEKLTKKKKKKMHLDAELPEIIPCFEDEQQKKKKKRAHVDDIEEPEIIEEIQLIKQEEQQIDLSEDTENAVREISQSKKKKKKKKSHSETENNETENQPQPEYCENLSRKKKKKKKHDNDGNQSDSSLPQISLGLFTESFKKSKHKSKHKS